MHTVSLKGKVFSGEGIGRYFMGIAWVRKQVKEKLGFFPHLGTLNVHLQKKEARMLKKILKKSRNLKIIPEKGFFQASLFHALIMNRIEGAIVIPEKPDYPADVLEIIAPYCLRETLSLEDNDEVEIRISLSS